MSGPIFVLDAEGTPLMPMSPAHTRRLLNTGKATRIYHHAFTVIQLTKRVPQPHLRPILVGITLHRHTAELWVVAEGVRGPIPLLSLVIDLRTDLSHRLRRRAGHRHRRRARQRYHSPARYGVPYKLRRSSLHRSRWRQSFLAAHQKISRIPRQRFTPPPTIRWRAAAIVRVLHALKTLIPISHLSLLGPLATTQSLHQPISPSERRQRVMRMQTIHSGNGAAFCSYCGTSLGRMEVDHIYPRASGGTDRLDNLALSCASCNARKGAQDPIRAGIGVSPGSMSQRSKPYRHQTAHALITMLAEEPLMVWWQRQREETAPGISPELHVALLAIGEQSSTECRMVAKPIARQRKQIYTARHYPASMLGEPSLVQVGMAVKRRLRINKGLMVGPVKERRTLLVLPADGSVLPDMMLVKIGTLCEARRGGKLIRGIVTAIHSSGRLTLSLPQHASPEGIVWQRVVVSPRAYLRIRATSAVLFMPISKGDNDSEDPKAKETV